MIKKRLAFTFFALLVATAHITWAAADWDDDDDATKAAKSTHVHAYSGGGDEQDLKVQAILQTSGRTPDSAARVEKKPLVDGDGNSVDD